jgi:hypothetical protein
MMGLVTLARFLVSLPVNQEEGCPDIGANTQVAGAQALPQGESRIWGDINCSGGVSLADSIGISRFLVSLPVDVPGGCPALGADVTLG